jgi:hypothetical protein
MRTGVWTKSTFSNPNGNCVEVRRNADGTTDVRDGKHPDAARHRYTSAEWDAFLAGARAGQFD